jgi:hypothetical protein
MVGVGAGETAFNEFQKRLRPVKCIIEKVSNKQAAHIGTQFLPAFTPSLYSADLAGSEEESIDEQWDRAEVEEGLLKKLKKARKLLGFS